MGSGALGFGSGSGIDVTVSDSIAARNTNVGIYTQTVEGIDSATVKLFHSVVANNGIGVQSLVATKFYLAQTMITANTTGFDARPFSTMFSYGDNYIDGNGSNLGVLTSIGKQ